MVRTFYPTLEPFDSGLLEVGDGQQIYYEVSGNPDGKPAVYLHGGPGGASSPDQRRVFDPAKYRIVLFDQRGCANTTWHLVADVEALRLHLGIDRWLVCGGSWGSTLALAYAQKHPTRVSELVLRGIFTLRKSELDWFYEGGASAIYPDLWEGFLAPVPEAERGHLIAAYSRLLNDPDPAVHVPAATAWSRWESSTITLLADQELINHFTEDAFAVAFARIENHFFMHGGWCDDGQLIRDDGPTSHHTKRGTPTMGGVAILAAIGLGNPHVAQALLEVGVDHRHLGAGLVIGGG